MRVMLMIKGDPEPGAAPSEELLTAMGRYNDELKRAGVLLDLAGLVPSAEGRRVKFSGGSRAVINGPFDESKKLTSNCSRTTALSTKQQRCHAQAAHCRRLASGAVPLRSVMPNSRGRLPH
jgi:hypothetical protein